MSNANGAWTGSIVWWHNSATNMFGAGTARTLSPTTVAYGSVHPYSYTSTPL